MKPARTLIATVAAALALAACSTEEEFLEEPEQVLDDDTPAAPVERDPNDFTMDGEPSVYAVSFNRGTKCVYLDKGPGRDGYFACDLDLAGEIPPLDHEVGIGTPTDSLLWDDEIGFTTTHDTGGGEIDPVGETLAPGEQVTISSYTFTHDKDGTVRGERDGYWFEVSPNGQYSSDHFTP